MKAISVIWVLSGLFLVFNLMTQNTDKAMTYAGIHIGANIAFRIIHAYQEIRQNAKDNYTNPDA